MSLFSLRWSAWSSPKAEDLNHPNAINRDLKPAQNTKAIFKMPNELEKFLNDHTIKPQDLKFDCLQMVEKVTEVLLSKTMSLEATERLESILKYSLSVLLGQCMPGTDARRLCQLLKRQGLWFKYKPYAVKASNPFGYSIFLQRECQGFSFQNHLEHKTEVFHILDVLPGGYVFLCRYSDWIAHYDQPLFEKWLAGQPHPFFDSCKHLPRPGDTFVISELGVVHTVIGCVLEEFATISTDMVQRLYDQNDRDQVPMPSRQEITDQLSCLKLPIESREINLIGPSENNGNFVRRIKEPFGHSDILTDTFLKASHHWIYPDKATRMEVDRERVVVIRIFEGTGSVLLHDESEFRENLDTESISVTKGDVLVIPKNVYFQIENNSPEDLAYSEHRIRQEVALA